MTLGPIRYLQKWSSIFPGEVGQHGQLPTHSCKAQQREAAATHSLKRSGVVSRGHANTVPISVPVAPALPKLSLSVSGLDSPAQVLTAKSPFVCLKSSL
jgi:hypothetical protein